MQYTVNQKKLSYHAEGLRHRGSQQILLQEAIDLTAATSWHNAGFTIEKLFPPAAYAAFSENIYRLLITLWQEAGIEVPSGLPLDQYHTIVTDFKTHLTALEKTKLLSVEQLPFGAEQMEKRISQICNVSVKAKNPFDGQSIFHFRVVRPNSSDNNPLHRDVWLEDYDDCINLYIPIAGSNEQSSLIILPGSHLWPESKIERTTDGALINGIKFNVPAVTAIDGDYETARPNPKENEVLVFSPYLIHGGSVNLNHNRTRISIEMRLWKDNRK